MPVTMHVHEIDVFMKKLKSVGGGAEKYMDAVVGRCMTNDLWPHWIKQISMRDHSLEDLRALGHPYSTRYGANSFVHPDEVVHVQDGALLGGSRVERVTGSTDVKYRLVNDAPEYVFLRYGTSKMRMRDPGGAAMRDALPAIKARFENEVRASIVQFVTKG